MTTVNPDTTQGKDLFEGDQSFYAHDDRADNKTTAGTYEHEEVQFSATEAEAIMDWARYVNLLLSNGVGSFAIRNESGGELAAATWLYVSSFDVAEQKFLVEKADADDPLKPPQMVLLTSLANNTNGRAYISGDVAGIDTSAAGSVGDPVYLSATAGEWTVSAPTGSNIWNLGVVTVDNVSGTIRFFPPVQSAIAAYSGIDGTPIGANSASTGAFSTVDIDGGTIDGTAIGGTTPAAASVTNLTVKEATPDIEFKDTDCTDDDVNASVVVNATDTGSGIEDIDVSIKQQTAGTLNETLLLDADGHATLNMGTAEKTLVLGPNSIVWKDINLGAASLTTPAASAPDKVNLLDEGGGDTDIVTYGFEATEKVSGSIELQHDYKEGTDVYFHVHWQGNAAPTGTDKVKWQLDYTLMKNGATLDATTPIVIETDFDTQYQSKISDFPAITGTAFNIEDQFVFKLTRIAASADEYAGDALIATVGLHYQVDTLGSRQRTVK